MAGTLSGSRLAQLDLPLPSIHPLALTFFHERHQNVANAPTRSLSKCRRSRNGRPSWGCRMLMPTTPSYLGVPSARATSGWCSRLETYLCGCESRHDESSELRSHVDSPCAATGRVGTGKWSGVEICAGIKIRSSVFWGRCPPVLGLVAPGGL